MVIPGDVKLVFDAKLWAGKDVGDNSQFYKEATILNMSDDGKLADVRFHHSNRVSRGHFTYGMKELL